MSYSWKEVPLGKVTLCSWGSSGDADGWRQLLTSYTGASTSMEGRPGSTSLRLPQEIWTDLCLPAKTLEKWHALNWPFQLCDFFIFPYSLILITFWTSFLMLHTFRAHCHQHGTIDCLPFLMICINSNFGAKPHSPSTSLVVLAVMNSSWYFQHHSSYLMLLLLI